MVQENEQLELSIEDRLEAAYTACKNPVEEVYHGLKRVMREYLEEQGFIVELMKRQGTQTEKVLEYFFLDRMLSYEQVRNGIIRNQSDAMRHVECRKNQVNINIEIMDKYCLSYFTVEKIRWRER